LPSAQFLYDQDFTQKEECSQSRIACLRVRRNCLEYLHDMTVGDNDAARINEEACAENGREMGSRTYGRVG
jgi:hypothetical protein